MAGPWAFWHQIMEHLRNANALLISVDLYVPIVLGYVALPVLLPAWGAVIVGLTLATGAFGGAFLAALQYSP